jgi:transcriptional regulator with XRE-family HTH domain
VPEDDRSRARRDLAPLLRRIRAQRGLSLVAASELGGVQTETIRRLERGASDVQIETLHRYLSSLGFTLDLVVTDATTGEEQGCLRLEPMDDEETDG